MDIDQFYGLNKKNFSFQDSNKRNILGEGGNYELQENKR